MQERTVWASIVDTVLDHVEKSQARRKRDPVGIQKGSQSEAKLVLLVKKLVTPLQERTTLLEKHLVDAYKLFEATVPNSTAVQRWRREVQETLIYPVVHGRAPGTLADIALCGARTVDGPPPRIRVSGNPDEIDCIECLRKLAEVRRSNATAAAQDAIHADARADKLEKRA